MNNREIGFMGERLVFEYFKQIGCKVEKNFDNYDPEKDIIIDGKNSEIKTQTLYRKFPFGGGFTPAFTVDIASDNKKIYRNQLNKCMNVDRLFFVKRSSLGDPVVKIFEAQSIGNRYFSIIQNKKDNRYVAGFLLQDMKEIACITRKSVVDFFMDDWLYG